ncbi:MAG: nucleotide pyrophosphohydrolase [Candidatus Parcubacteria bacterium]|nr:nucleotide pyrophosphohydrolase [Candidatus Parcubacteria bacterium]
MKKHQKAVDDFVQGFAEPYWPVLSQFARLAEEVGEVGRILNHMYGSKPKKSSENKQELGEELADVLFTLICLANTHKIDLDTEITKVLNKSKTRDKDRFNKK